MSPSAALAARETKLLMRALAVRRRVSANQKLGGLTLAWKMMCPRMKATTVRKMVAMMR
jgi:hypothetical protein